jgi:hypothetical protein
MLGRCVVVSVLSLNFGAPNVGVAQGPAPSILWQKPALAPARKAPDHRWEGMAIGAGVGAVAGGLLGLVACGGQQEASGGCTAQLIGLGLGGALAGGVIGGLIGAAFPKGEPPDSTAES